MGDDLIAGGQNDDRLIGGLGSDFRVGDVPPPPPGTEPPPGAIDFGLNDRCIGGAGDTDSSIDCEHNFGVEEIDS